MLTLIKINSKLLTKIIVLMLVLIFLPIMMLQAASQEYLAPLVQISNPNFEQSLRQGIATKPFSQGLYFLKDLEKTIDKKTSDKELELLKLIATNNQRAEKYINEEQKKNFIFVELNLAKELLLNLFTDNYKKNTTIEQLYREILTVTLLLNNNPLEELRPNHLYSSFKQHQEAGYTSLIGIYKKDLSKNKEKHHGQISKFIETELESEVYKSTSFTYSLPGKPALRITILFWKIENKELTIKKLHNKINKSEVFLNQSTNISLTAEKMTHFELINSNNYLYNKDDSFVEITPEIKDFLTGKYTITGESNLLSQELIIMGKIVIGKQEETRYPLLPYTPKNIDEEIKLLQVAVDKHLKNLKNEGVEKDVKEIFEKALISACQEAKETGYTPMFFFMANARSSLFGMYTGEKTDVLLINAMHNIGKNISEEIYPEFRNELFDLDLQPNQNRKQEIDIAKATKNMEKEWVKKNQETTHDNVSHTLEHYLLSMPTLLKRFIYISRQGDYSEAESIFRAIQPMITDFIFFPEISKNPSQAAGLMTSPIANELILNFQPISNPMVIQKFEIPNAPKEDFILVLPHSIQDIYVYKQIRAQFPHCKAIITPEQITHNGFTIPGQDNFPIICLATLNYYGNKINIMSAVKKDSQAIIDVKNGIITVNPDDEDSLAAMTILHKNEEIYQFCKDRLLLPVINEVGETMSLMFNISSFKKGEEIAKSGGKGVALYRSESEYQINNKLITEDKWVEMLTQLVDTANVDIITLRLLDRRISTRENEDSKNIAAFGTSNFEGLTYLLKKNEIGREQITLPQIKACLRVFVKKGIIRATLPMLSNSEEQTATLELLAKAKQELIRDGKITNENDIAKMDEFSLSFMFETPESIKNRDTLMREINFASIGSNDLTRKGESINDLTPERLKQLNQLIKSAKKHNVSLSLCGMLANSPEFLILSSYFITKYKTTITPSIGLEEKNVAYIKEFLRNFDQEAFDMTEEILKYNYANTVELKKAFKQIIDHITKKISMKTLKSLTAGNTGNSTAINKIKQQSPLYSIKQAI